MEEFELKSLQLSVSNSVLEAWAQLATDTAILLQGNSGHGDVSLKLMREAETTTFVLEDWPHPAFRYESQLVACSFLCTSTSATMVPIHGIVQDPLPPAEKANLQLLLNFIESQEIDGKDKIEEIQVHPDEEASTFDGDQSLVSEIIRSCEDSTMCRTDVADEAKSPLAEPVTDCTLVEVDGDLNEEDVEETEEANDSSDEVWKELPGPAVYRCYICMESSENLDELHSHFTAIHGFPLFKQKQGKQSNIKANVQNCKKSNSDITSNVSLTIDRKSVYRKFKLNKRAVEQTDTVNDTKLEQDNLPVQLETDESWTPVSRRENSDSSQKGIITIKPQRERCPSCRHVMSKSDIVAHKLTCLGGHRVGGQFSCNQCSYRGRTRQLLKSHMRTMHTVVPPNQRTCHHCSKAFNNVPALHIHLREVHQDPVSGRPLQMYQCTICNRSFVRKQRLERHLTTHTGEKPFQCDLCPRKFSTQGNLTSHRDRFHFDRYPIRCDRCGLGLGKAKYLEIHRCKHSLLMKHQKRLHEALKALPDS